MSSSSMRPPAKRVENAEPEKSASGFPLGALFLLTAVSCIVAGHLLPVWRGYEAGEVGGRNLFVAAMAGGALSFCIGAGIGGLLGLHYSPVWMAVLAGAVTGLGLGALLGPILFTPPERLGELALTSVVGSIVLLSLGFVLRPRSA